MKCIVIINNDAEQLKREKRSIGLRYKGVEVMGVSDPFMAVKFILNNNVSRVYVEVKLKPVSGFDLLKVLRKNTPLVEVYLVAEGNEFKEDAMRASANGYIMRGKLLLDM